MSSQKEKRGIALRLAIFVVVVLLAWTHFLKADDGALNIFQDRDQDGLADAEEKTYSTDPLRADTDGDGYSDKVEIESGYNPLKPAPGDKLIAEEEGGVNVKNIIVAGEATENLTDQFIDKIQNKKGEEFSLLQELTTNPDKFTDEEYQNKLQEISLTENELQNVLNGSISGSDINGELELINEDEIKLLPAPKGTDKQRQKEEKKQIEEYLTAVGYVMTQDSPINIREDISTNELESQWSSFLTIASGMFEEGNANEISKIKEKVQKVYDNLKMIEVPVKMKDTHIKALSLVNYLLKDDPNAVTNADDPLRQLMFIGKVQAVMNEFSALIDDAQKIVDEYDINLTEEQDNHTSEN